MPPGTYIVQGDSLVMSPRVVLGNSRPAMGAIGGAPAFLGAARGWCVLQDRLRWATVWATVLTSRPPRRVGTRRYAEAVRKLRQFWAFIALVLLVIGLPTVGDGIAGWAAWLRWLRDGHWQLVSVVAGAALLVVAEGPVVYRYFKSTSAPDASAAPAAPAAGLPASVIVAPDPASHSDEQRVARQPPLRDAVAAQQTLGRRRDLLAEARAERAADFRRIFDVYVDALFGWRRELVGGMTPERRAAVAQEYRQLHRAVTAAYRRIRDRYQDFLLDEPRYDIRGQLFDDGLAGAADYAID